MKQNDNRSMGALIVSITFGVVVFTALFIQHQSSNKPVIIIPSTEEKHLFPLKHQMWIQTSPELM